MWERITHNDNNELIVDRSDGIVPVMLFVAKDRCSRPDMLSRNDGNAPLKLFDGTYNAFRVLRSCRPDKAVSALAERLFEGRALYVLWMTYYWIVFF